MKHDFRVTIPLVQHSPLIHFQTDQKGATLRASELKPKLDRFIFFKLKDLDKDLYQKNISLINRQFDPSKKVPAPYKIHIQAEVNPDKKYLIASYLKGDQRKVLEKEGIKYLANTPYFAQEKETGEVFETEKQFNERKGRELDVAIGILEKKKGEIQKWGMFAKSNEKDKNPRFYLSLFSLNPKVISLIKTVLPYVLASENFGTRQSKGFGGFYTSDDRADFESKLSSTPGIDAVYKRSVGRGQHGGRNRHANDPFQVVFEEIGRDYKILKSGSNYPYMKSLLFYYACSLSNPIRWDKRFIKREIKKILDDPNIRAFDTPLKENHHPDDCGDRNSWEDNGKYTYRYIRAMLGLAEQLEFQTMSNNLKYVVSISNSNGEIQRFRSPLTFKVFQNTIYLLVNQKALDDFIKEVNASFNLKLTKKVNNNKQDPEENLSPISIPSTFSLTKFLDRTINENSKAPEKEKLTNQYTKIK